VFDVLVVFLFSEQCPGELLRTDKGKFLWEPVPHGMASRLPCPYGMSTNYTEHLEQLAHDSTLELGYHIFHNPAAQLKPDDLDKANSHHELVSDAEMNVSYGNAELIRIFLCLVSPSK
jgi:hypothetical protein